MAKHKINGLDKKEKSSEAKREKTLTELTMTERVRAAESQGFASPSAKEAQSSLSETIVGPSPEKVKPAKVEKQQKAQETAVLAHKPQKDFVDHYDLPATYNTTNITLIARDPYWIFAYWEIASSAVEEIKNRVGPDFDTAKYTLRVYDVTCVNFNGENANSWFDIEVSSHTNNWYINTWCDNISYCADIGIRLSDGRFFTLARSNFVTTPRVSLSNRSEQMWMELKADDTNQQPFVVGDIKRRQEENSFPQKNPNSSAKKNPNSAHHGTKRSRKILLTEEDIRNYYSRLSPLLRDIISARLSRQALKTQARNNRVSVYIKGNRLSLEELLRKGLSRHQFFKKILLGSSEEMVFLGASELLIQGASESLGASERQQQKRKFFFEIGTELIVYGRTEPDAQVWLGKKRIPLRSDGTFTLRFALPDGKIPLDFVAVSNDTVARREIKTSVERSKTVYNP